MPIRVDVHAGPYGDVPCAELLRRARVMAKALQLGKTEISILLTDDGQIQELNRRYRRRDEPTDVLAFAMREGPMGAPGSDLLGDVVLSVPRAREQASLRGAHVMAEITMLLAHGILHLLGWDHDTPAKDRRMRAETDRLCALATRSNGRTAGKLAAAKRKGPRRRARRRRRSR